MLKNKFYSKANKYLVIFFMLFIVSSCSSLSSLKFWGSDEIDPDEPVVLEAIKNAININVDWRRMLRIASRALSTTIQRRMDPVQAIFVNKVQ